MKRHALYDLSYEEVGKICGCAKVAVHLSVEAVRKKFLKFFQKSTLDGVVNKNVL